jgi:hypothetical protein
LNKKSGEHFKAECSLAASNTISERNVINAHRVKWMFHFMYLIIPRSGKHQPAERKTSFHGKENTNPHKESSNPLMESTSCIIELEA